MTTQFGFHGLILGVVGTLLITLMIVHQIYKTKDSACKIHVIISLLTYSSYILFTITLLIMSILEITNTFNQIGCYIWLYWGIWQTIGKILMYFFFTIRLSQIFDDSIFAYSKTRLIIFVSVSSLISFIFSGLIGVTVIEPTQYIAIHKPLISSYEDCTNVYDEAHQNHNYPKVWVIIGIAGYTLTDLIISIIILRLYLKKLLLLSITFDRIEESIMILRSNSHSFSEYNLKHVHSNANQKEMEKERQKNGLFLALSIKTTNVLILAISTYYVAFIAHALRFGQKWNTLDVVVNCLSIYLSFNFAQPLYDKLFSKCNNCWYKIFVRICFRCCCITNRLPNQMELYIQQTFTRKNATMSTINAESTVTATNDIEIITAPKSRNSQSEFI